MKTKKKTRKPVAKKSRRTSKTTAKRAAAPKKTKPRKTSQKAASTKKRRTRAPAVPVALLAARRRGVRAYEPPELPAGGLGADAGGQSGDIEGLSRRSRADSQSVVELLEEGQSFEAGVIAGVEEADGGGEVRTREFPEDDVPPEYRDQ
jgi:hypothetical protein